VAVKPLALAFALALVCCASLPPCPARGGPAWNELQSPHFDLLTDLDIADARAALRDFEELRTAVMIAAWRRAPEPQGRIVVFVLRSDAERRVFVPNGWIGSFVRNPPLRQSFLVKSGTERDEVVTQGLVYAISDRYGLHGKARWFDVGLAEYLGTLTLDEGGKLTYGEVDPILFRALARRHIASFKDLWTEPNFATRGRVDATSWLAVHYLFNHEAARFERFQRLLIETRDARAAWTEVFPDLTPEEMDARLDHYLSLSGTYTSFETHVPPVVADASVTPIGDARVHALRALLYQTAAAVPPAEKPALVRAEVNEALRLDAYDALAVYVQRVSLHEQEDDLLLPLTLIAREPKNAIGWLLLARAHLARHEAAEAAEAWRHLDALVAPDTPVGLDLRVARPD